MCDQCRETLGDELPPSCNKELTPLQIHQDLLDLPALPEEEIRKKARKFAKVQDDMTSTQKKLVAEGLAEYVESITELQPQDVEDFSAYLVEAE